MLQTESLRIEYGAVPSPLTDAVGPVGVSDIPVITNKPSPSRPRPPRKKEEEKRP